MTEGLLGCFSIFFRIGCKWCVLWFYRGKMIELLEHLVDVVWQREVKSTAVIIPCEGDSVVEVTILINFSSVSQSIYSILKKSMARVKKIGWKKWVYISRVNFASTCCKLFLCMSYSCLMSFKIRFVFIFM